MVIGKAGNYIKQIKEESGAYVQISQKSKETNLPERCITVAGTHTDFELFIIPHTINGGGGGEKKSQSIGPYVSRSYFCVFVHTVFK